MQFGAASGEQTVSGKTVKMESVQCEYSDMCNMGQAMSTYLVYVDLPEFTSIYFNTLSILYLNLPKSVQCEYSDMCNMGEAMSTYLVYGLALDSGHRGYKGGGHRMVWCNYWRSSNIIKYH